MGYGDPNVRVIFHSCVCFSFVRSVIPNGFTTVKLSIKILKRVYVLKMKCIIQSIWRSKLTFNLSLKWKKRRTLMFVRPLNLDLLGQSRLRCFYIYTNYFIFLEVYGLYFSLTFKGSFTFR